MDGDDACRALGLDARATPAEIRRAFRARARRTHPDAGGDAAAFVDALTARAALLGVASQSSSHRPVALAPRPTVDCYDSAPRRAPVRTFEDALRVASARWTSTH
jgi:hypothetical protein